MQKIFRKITQFKTSQIKFTSCESRVSYVTISNYKIVGHNSIKKGERKMKEKKDLESISKLQWQHHRYCCKDLDDTNLMMPIKVFNIDQSGPHEQPKNKWVPTTLNSSCGSLYSSFITFFSVVGFVLSRFFQQHWWCHHWSFNVSPGLFFFFLFLCFFSLLSSL